MFMAPLLPARGSAVEFLLSEHALLFRGTVPAPRRGVSHRRELRARARVLRDTSRNHIVLALDM